MVEMKRTLVLVAAALVAVASLAAPGNLRTNATVEWQYPETELSTNLTFKLYSTTNVAQPTAEWPLLTTVVGTNLQVTVPIDAAQRFFVLTASNWWGESDFSNVASTPVLPRSDVTVRIGP